MRHTSGDCQLGDDSPLFHRTAYLIAESPIPLSPSRQMIVRRQAVTFLAVASVIRQDKVVAEIYWIAGPCNEVIDVRAEWRQGSLAVETTSLLNVDLDGTNHGECSAFTAKEKLV